MLLQLRIFTVIAFVGAQNLNSQTSVQQYSTDPQGNYAGIGSMGGMAGNPFSQGMGSQWGPQSPFPQAQGGMGMTIDPQMGSMPGYQPQMAAPIPPPMSPYQSPMAQPIAPGMPMGQVQFPSFPQIGQLFGPGGTPAFMPQFPVFSPFQSQFAPGMGPPVMGPPVMGPPVMGPPVMGPPVMGPPVMGPPVMGPPVMGNQLMGHPIMNPGMPLSQFDQLQGPLVMVPGY